MCLRPWFLWRNWTAHLTSNQEAAGSNPAGNCALYFSELLFVANIIYHICFIALPYRYISIFLITLPIIPFVAPFWQNISFTRLAMGQLLRSGGFPNGFPHKYDLDTTIGPWLYAFSGQIFNDGRIGRAGMPCISLTLALRKNRGNSLQS